MSMLERTMKHLLMTTLQFFNDHSWAGYTNDPIALADASTYCQLELE